MSPSVAIMGAFAIFILFIVMIIFIVLALSAIFFRIRQYHISSHRAMLRKRVKESDINLQSFLDRTVLDLSPEEICSVSREEYEADMRNSAPLSPLEGCDPYFFEMEALRNQTGFFKPSLN
ncbi:MAG: hypothetical protein K2M10_05865 [Muribaculaceae bacterium]|nr:hypothetical protein [Muribaculaceae bacterium]